MEQWGGRMNATSKTYFEKNLATLQQEKEEIKKEIQEHVARTGIKSHMLGDKKYYRLHIKQWEKILEIRRAEAILSNSEYSYINHRKPVILNKIRQLRDMLLDAPEVIQ